MLQGCPDVPLKLGDAVLEFFAHLGAFTGLPLQEGQPLNHRIDLRPVIVGSPRVACVIELYLPVAHAGHLRIHAVLRATTSPCKPRRPSTFQRMLDPQESGIYFEAPIAQTRGSSVPLTARSPISRALKTHGL